MAAPDFSTKTVDALAKRAALRCSNPDCDRLTAGPHTDEAKALITGEAAHIYGARSIAARFRVEMTDVERAAPINGIWLCADCHAKVDKDAARYTADLLILWKRDHEEKLMTEQGRRGDKLRSVAHSRALSAFQELPLYIYEIAAEQPPYWEFVLTAELLDYRLKPVLRRVHDLKHGLVTRPSASVSPEAFFSWVHSKNAELIGAVAVLGRLLPELQKAWGEPGEPGVAEEIDHASQLLVQCAEHFVAIGEEATFTHVPEGCEGVSKLLADGALHALVRFPELPKFIRDLFSRDDPSGTHVFQLEVSLPDGWEEEFEQEATVAYSYITRSWAPVL